MSSTKKYTNETSFTKILQVLRKFHQFIYCDIEKIGPKRVRQGVYALCTAYGFSV